jgi:hypothetical protein
LTDRCHVCPSECVRWATFTTELSAFLRSCLHPSRFCLFGGLPPGDPIAAVSFTAMSTLWRLPPQIWASSRALRANKTGLSLCLARLPCRLAYREEQRCRIVVLGSSLRTAMNNWLDEEPQLVLPKDPDPSLFNEGAVLVLVLATDRAGSSLINTAVRCLVLLRLMRCVALFTHSHTHLVSFGTRFCTCCSTHR